MKKSKFTEEQIAYALKQAELGTPVAEVCRKMGISDATFYNWRTKYGGLSRWELPRLKQLEEENAKLKRLVADLSLDKAMHPGCAVKKTLKPSRRRELVTDLMQRFGARGWRDNHKRVERVYRELGLSLRHKRPRCDKSARRRQPKQSVSAINEIWSMDFVADALFDGRRLRTLTIVDNYTLECLAIEVDGSLGGEHVVAALTRLAQRRALPRYINADNGSEFISKARDKSAYENGVEIDFSRPGKPTDNAKNESFNRRFREECLNAH